jgi:hypothetical protein
VQNISFEGNRQKPKVLFDWDKGVLGITGRSLPEQAHDLYKPLLDWIDEYSKSPQQRTIFNIYLEYINSSSNKYLLLILKKLDELFLSGNTVEINWHYDEDDEDLIETAEECQRILSVQIHLCPESSEYDDE